MSITQQYALDLYRLTRARESAARAAPAGSGTGTAAGSDTGSGSAPDSRSGPDSGPGSGSASEAGSGPGSGSVYGGFAPPPEPGSHEARLLLAWLAGRRFRRRLRSPSRPYAPSVPLSSPARHTGAPCE